MSAHSLMYMLVYILSHAALTISTLVFQSQVRQTLDWSPYWITVECGAQLTCKHGSKPLHECAINRILSPSEIWALFTCLVFRKDSQKSSRCCMLLNLNNCHKALNIWDLLHQLKIENYINNTMAIMSWNQDACMCNPRAESSVGQCLCRNKHLHRPVLDSSYCDTKWDNYTLKTNDIALIGSIIGS